MPQLQDTKADALRALPGATKLLSAVSDRPGTYIVGGAVRDLMLGFAQFDFDLLVEGDAASLAEHLADVIGGTVKRHERFLTATFESDDRSLLVDIAQARSETYAAPGALPDVTPADIETDLTRRDFAINAIALAIWEDRFGEIVEYPGASDDLLARRLRVLSDNSFIDDPTRLLRLLRYGARLGFTADPQTEQLARDAVDAGVVSSVSGPRIRDELLDLLAERSAVVALESMNALGLDRALHRDFEADEYLAARALNEHVEGVRQELLLLALCSRSFALDELHSWLESLAVGKKASQIVEQCVARGPGLLEGLQAASAASEFASILSGLNVETMLFALALPGGDRETSDALRRWLEDRNSGKLEISGADLRDAGVHEGPAIGRALAETLAATIDGSIIGRDEQLVFALADVRRDED